MTDNEDRRAEVRRLREEVGALQRRLDAVESAIDPARAGVAAVATAAFATYLGGSYIRSH
jgi:hypothetical protein